MPGDVRDTLLLPFEKNEIPYPDPRDEWAFINAGVLPDRRFLEMKSLHCVQPFRPAYLMLENAGYRVSATMPEKSGHSGVLLLLGRNRKLNEHNFALAWNSLNKDGVLICAGDKKAGIQSFRKWVSKRTDIDGSLSKHHAQVFWMRKSGADWPVDDLTQTLNGYRISPGMFSANGPDSGSAALARQFDERLAGAVADFGAGWGYLSNELLKNCAAVTSLDLFEADHPSLEAARLNVKPRAGVEINFHWHDVVDEPIGKKFDVIIMNPPFHVGRDTDFDLGRAFIDKAASCLSKGGRLLMVANTHLPYERDLQAPFRKINRIAQQDGFKVLEAVL